MLDKLKNLRWQPFVAIGLVLGAYYATKALHLDTPSWLADGVVVCGAVLIGWVRGMLPSPPQSAS